MQLNLSIGEVQEEDGEQKGKVGAVVMLVVIMLHNSYYSSTRWWT
jgi:hypothetical protein